MAVNSYMGHIYNCTNLKYRPGIANELEFTESCHTINRFGMVSSKASITMGMNANNGERELMQEEEVRGDCRHKLQHKKFCQVEHANNSRVTRHSNIVLR